MTKYGEKWLNWAIQIEEAAGCDVEAGIPLEQRSSSRFKRTACPRCKSTKEVFKTVETADCGLGDWYCGNCSIYFYQERSP